MRKMSLYTVLSTVRKHQSMDLMASKSDNLDEDDMWEVDSFEWKGRPRSLDPSPRAWA